MRGQRQKSGELENFHRLSRGRAPVLQDQAPHPFRSPVETALPSHNVILDIASEIDACVKAFRDIFGVRARQEHDSQSFAPSKKATSS